MTALLEYYLDYVAETESPVLYHRWSFLSAVAANLGRNVYFDWGHVGRIYPNMYCLLIGSPGTRKDSAIKSVKDILLNSGYRTFTDATASYEQFLDDFNAGFEKVASDKKQKLLDLKDIVCASSAFTIDSLDMAFSKISTQQAQEVYILAGEFANFIGENNKRFTTGLTALWDNPDTYGDSALNKRRKVFIENPCVNILGGMTPSSFNTYIPQEIKDAGFTARVNLIYASRTNNKITFPPPPDAQMRQELITAFSRMRELSGEIQLTPTAAELLDAIYTQESPPKDVRLHYYHDRRLVHLIKLMICLAATDGTVEVTAEHVYEANTIQSYTESFMTKALGEYGFSKTSIAMQKIMEALNSSAAPLSIPDIMQAVSTEIDSLKSLADILGNLKSAGKIQESRLTSDAKIYYIPCKLLTNFKDKFAVNSAYIREFNHEFNSEAT